eukprot:9380750-Alexandrium_andersonii.AAC.1
MPRWSAQAKLIKWTGGNLAKGCGLRLARSCLDLDVLHLHFGLGCLVVLGAVVRRSGGARP